MTQTDIFIINIKLLNEMKKFLLLAATAAMFGSAYAQVPCEGTLKQDWKVTSVPAHADARQGFGLNGKFYINVKGENPSIQIYDQNGLTNSTLPGGSNVGISYDQAGNIIVSTSPWPSSGAASAKIVSADGKTTKDISFEGEDGVGVKGRCDFLGVSEGNVLSEDGGCIYVVGATNTGILAIPVVSGAVAADEILEVPVSGVELAPSTSTVVNFFPCAKSEDESDAVLYVTRNASPVLVTVKDDAATGTAITLPKKNACNGAFPFTLGGYTLYAYPSGTNYLDGFCISEAGAENPVVEYTETLPTAPNSTQANWLNVEKVDDRTANIYQYVPGAYMAKYTFTLNKSITGVENNVASKTVASTTYYNVAGVASATPFTGVNVKVVKYTDGTKKAVKVIK